MKESTVFLEVSVSFILETSKDKYYLDDLLGIESTEFYKQGSQLAGNVVLRQNRWVITERYPLQSDINNPVRSFYGSYESIFRKSVNLNQCRMMLKINLVTEQYHSDFTLEEKDLDLFQKYHISVDISFLSYGLCGNDQ